MGTRKNSNSLTRPSWRVLFYWLLSGSIAELRHELERFFQMLVPHPAAMATAAIHVASWVNSTATRLSFAIPASMLREPFGWPVGY
jgi:hypothetical protein